MASCFEYLKTLINSQDKRVLPKSFTTAIKFLPTGSSLYTAATCDLPQEVQQHIKAILADHSYALPDRIKNELQVYCQCKKPTGVLKFLIEYKPSNVASITAGALAITLIGYATVQYAMKHIEKVRKEERAFLAKETAGYETQLLEKQAVYHVKLAALERRFTESLDRKVEEARDELITQIGELNAAKKATDMRVDELEKDRESTKAQILELVKARIEGAEDENVQTNLLGRIVTLVEGLAKRQQTLVQADELEAIITKVMTRIAEESDDEGEEKAQIPKPGSSKYESENLNPKKDEMIEGSESSSAAADEHHTAADRLVDTLPQNAAFLDGNTTTENVSSWISDQAPKIRSLFDVCTADREHHDYVLVQIKKKFSEMIFKAESDHLRKYHEEVVNTNDVRTALRFISQALLEQALIHNNPSKVDPILAAIKVVIEQAVGDTEGPEGDLSTVEDMAESLHDFPEAKTTEDHATWTDAELALLHGNENKNEALKREVELEVALADAASAPCPNIIEDSNESPKSVSSEWDPVELPSADTQNSSNDKTAESNILSEWDELNTAESEGWEGAVFDQ
ncbi:hypothetical protein BU16DRAFT_598919 [Lophium mytilinum]|uniref:Uncharacterized protein n=1 Tax=Lophium mytilinum TaxID=390894 RepID=A0A6A6RBG6_9PEZI|nr:hypothetical protein BU16DRAFT_598919 [Lophium mytilinum]